MRPGPPTGSDEFPDKTRDKTRDQTSSSAAASTSTSASTAGTRLFLPVEAFSLHAAGGSAHSQDPAVSHQLRHVLRLKSGDGVSLLDGLGNLWWAKIVSMERNETIFQLLELRQSVSTNKKKTLSLIHI